MSFELTKVYEREVPALCFIGKCYGFGDMRNGSYGHLWSEWFQKGWFVPLEALGPHSANDSGVLGLMRQRGADESWAFEYWIGQYFEPDTEAPAGYETLDLPASRLAIVWVTGKEPDIYGAEPMKATWQQAKKELSAKIRTIDDWQVDFELYNAPRFTEKATDGSCTLDYGFYVEDFGK